MEIPQVLELGKPSDVFSRHWSIRRWIEGQSINEIEGFEKQSLALPLARFLNELHALDGAGGPLAGLHSGHRGGDLLVYCEEVENAFSKLDGIINTASAQIIWKEALVSKYEKSPVWVHGDMSVGNLLFRDQQLSAVIDFGTMAVGDPACDLVVAWTFFEKESRSLFRQNLNRDAGMWARARGWALLKVLYTLAFNDQRTHELTVQAENLFAELLND